MPTLVWLSLTARLYDRPSSRGAALAEALEPVSHDRLTRMRQADWSGHTRRESAVRTLCSWEGGDRILDDTVMPMPCATTIERLAWVLSRQARTPVDGLSLVLLVWTHGTLRLPVGLRLWRKGGPSTYALALAWLSDARHRVHGHPSSGLFDAWSPSKRLLKRMRDDGWSVGCRLKQHRRVNGQPLRAYRRHPSWAATGRLPGGLKVLVVRGGAKDLCHQPPHTPSG